MAQIIHVFTGHWYTGVILPVFSSLDLLVGEYESLDNLVHAREIIVLHLRGF